MIVLQTFAGSTVQKVVLGMKADLVDQRQVSSEEAKVLMEALNMDYFEGSPPDLWSISFWILMEDFADSLSVRQRQCECDRSRPSDVLSLSDLLMHSGSW